MGKKKKNKHKKVEKKVVERKEIKVENKVENKVEKKEESTKKSCQSSFLDKYKDYLIPSIVIVLLAVVLVVVLVKDNKIVDENSISKTALEKEKAVSDKVAKKVEDKLRPAFEKKLLEGSKVDFKEVYESENMYRVKLMVDDSQEIDIYLTKDYAVLFAGNIIGSYIVDLGKTFKEMDGEPVVAVTPDELLNNTANELNLDGESFKNCMSEKRYEQKINDYIQEGMKAGVAGTPHSVLIVNGVQYELSGAQPTEVIKSNLDKALSGTLDLEKSKNIAKEVDASDHIRGNSNSSVAYIEYSDVDCPYCKKLHENMEEVVATYGDKVKFVFRPFPLDMHPNSKAKSEASECAGELGGEEAYWAFTDKMFKSK